MDHAITVGDMLGILVLGIGAIAIVGFLAWLFSVFADGFRH